MSRERHPVATHANDVLGDVAATWPPQAPRETRGYQLPDLRGLQPLAACDLGEGRVVVVVGRSTDAVTALPCVRTSTGWRIAVAGDGVALALLAGLETPEWAPPPGFEPMRFEEYALGHADERALGTDQSNISVVVGERSIVKWRSATDASGSRATRLRRHLAVNGFTRTPPLLAALAWTDGSGATQALADVDAFLPDAEDGWDHGISTLRTSMEASASTDGAYAGSIGRLTAQLHAGLLRPSAIVPQPTRLATPAQMAAIRAAGLGVLERALAIDADAQSEVIARGSRLRTAIEGMPSDDTILGPIHGDLHIGQLVAWRDGVDVIDFDGPPEPTAPAGDVDAPARDVAQMLCSLWSLAVVVDRRTDGTHTACLRDWAERAERGFMTAYRQELAISGTDALDERILEPFIAEQLCRELLYADTVLPRWRYAPLQVLRWRYPLGHHDDV